MQMLIDIIDIYYIQDVLSDVRCFGWTAIAAPEL